MHLLHGAKSLLCGLVERSRGCGRGCGAVEGCPQFGGGLAHADVSLEGASSLAFAALAILEVDFVLDGEGRAVHEVRCAHAILEKRPSRTSRWQWNASSILHEKTDWAAKSTDTETVLNGKYALHHVAFLALTLFVLVHKFHLRSVWASELATAKAE